MEKKAKLLIVEDESDFRKTLVKVLNKVGYDTFGVSDGRQAIDAAAKDDFDLIITDVRLPGQLDGIEAIKKIKEIKPDVRTAFIVMTAYSGDDAPIRAIKVGVGDYIFKPFEVEHFLHSVDRSLAVSRLEMEKDIYLAQIERMKVELEKHSHELAERVKEKTSALELMFAIGKEISSSLKLNEVLSTIVDRTAETIGADICSILLTDEIKEELYVAAAKGLPKDIIPTMRMKFGDNISGWVLKHREPILVDDIENFARFKESIHRKYYTGSFISVPLIFKEKVIGIINVSNKRNKEKFNSDDFAFIKSIADHASVAIANARFYNDLKGVYLQIVTALNSVIEIKDHYTKGHSERVTKYASMIAGAIGMSDSRMEVLETACQLHDLGKIGVHDYVLTKTEKLTDDEWCEMKLHAEKGAEILKPLTFLSSAIAMVEQHHERYDGGGYPNQVKGEDIIFEARIMAIADSFDAMTTDRPYSKAFTLSQATEELQKCKNAQFDPKIVDVFIQILKENPDLLTK
ncbi:MAG: response regulator [Candidatus Omnitrophica bacterium]|nr:response regulator [Candidatus Omnitrophota bacterium]